MSDQEQEQVVPVPSTAENVEAAFNEKFDDFLARLDNHVKEAKNLANDIKTFKKESAKVIKKLNGRRKKGPKNPNAPKKEPSGFAKPTKISVDLAKFLGVSEGDMIARPVVTSKITNYVKEHNLQREDNRRIIDLKKPGGDVLANLLQITDDVELTFFNLQKYLKIHFPAAKQPKPSKKKAEGEAVAKTVTAAVPKKKEESAKKKTEETEAPKTKSKAKKVEISETPVEDETKVRRKRKSVEEE